MGHNPTKSDRYYNIGGFTFLNREFPAECDGEITAWNYCYYSENLTNSQTYTATVALWRYNNATGQYGVVEGSTAVLTEVYTTRRFEADIYCRQKSLAPEKFIAVKEGDIIGVSLPLASPIPMLGNTNLDNFHYTWRFTANSPLSVLPGDLTHLPQAIHLYANIQSGTYEHIKHPAHCYIVDTCSGTPHKGHP